MPTPLPGSSAAWQLHPPHWPQEAQAPPASYPLLAEAGLHLLQDPLPHLRCAALLCSAMLCYALLTHHTKMVATHTHAHP
ncbi:hypothetical protein K431DRAFT_286213 [Polychaeton citri CBS 116435]|uniref:Uncharacterized protein n=1 Tax=Polychaeton citri CBS 116435 TaxID=1314669 RepID=A0A9P4Q822_9PEZI|nr:hypothetical protein K431DRAFT_286213 [Polychaeton citri CBS 116435]